MEDVPKPPSLGELAASQHHPGWVIAHCNNATGGCSYSKPMRLAELISLFGPNRTADEVGRRLKCGGCGKVGATLHYPGPVAIEKGFPEPGKG